MSKNIMKNKNAILSSSTSNLEISHFDKVLHELNTPVHGILSLADILNSDWNNIDEDKKRESVRDIYSSAQTLTNLVKTLKEDSDSTMDQQHNNIAD
jgi:K+-sensing histidine kinase KdpD